MVRGGGELGDGVEFADAAVEATVDSVARMAVGRVLSYVEGDDFGCPDFARVGDYSRGDIFVEVMDGDVGGVGRMEEAPSFS